MVIKVRCPNQACGQTSHLCDDGLRRVFRCPGCRTKLPSVTPIAPAWVRDYVEETFEAAFRDAAFQVDALSSDSVSIVSDPDDLSLSVSAPASAEEPDLGPSSRLGRLQLRDKIGVGSFATIYHAFDPLLERDVTLKVFRNAERDCSRDIDHFSTEAKALARLRHPQIVPIYDAGCEGAYHYIAMEFIQGRTLAEELSHGPIDVRHAAGIIAETAEALAYAHLHGIVHRDVKPSNIVLDAGGTAHLIDFGLAHRPGKVEDPDRVGAISGTPAYLAPEQAKGDDAPPHPSNDQYSLGAILYEMLCGRPPFNGPPLFVLISALEHEPPRPSALNPGVPPGLEAICLKALAKRPEERYPSCQALAEDVKRWLAGEPPLALEPASRTSPRRWFRQMRALAATFASLLA